MCEISGNQVLGTFYVSTCCSAGASTTNCGWSLLCSRGRIGSQCASLISSEAEAAQMLVLDVPRFRETGVFPFWARDGVPGSGYSLGSGCLMNNAFSRGLQGIKGVLVVLFVIVVI